MLSAKVGPRRHPFSMYFSAKERISLNFTQPLLDISQYNLFCRPTPRTAGTFRGNPERLRQDPVSALRVFPGNSLESMAGTPPPQTLYFKAFEGLQGISGFLFPAVWLVTPLFSEE